MTKAIGLISGGLDSILAAKIILEQGIEVVGASFSTPFFGSQGAERAAKELGVLLRLLDITEPHLAILRHPKHGYGNNMNPCIDCHALMLREAGRVMEQVGGDFIFTGEVLGQRPMSQSKAALKVVERESGYEGHILRPLSAKLLPETIPEKEGKVDREKLLDIEGRSRKRQMELSKRYHIRDYLSPAGGCLLTEPVFSRRMRDLFQQRGPFKIRDIELLKVGRHLRLSPDVKVIVGRYAEDNEKILRMTAPVDDLLKVEGYPGPLLLIPNGGALEDIKRAASICVRYSDAPKEEVITVIWRKNGKEKEVQIRSCHPDLPTELMI
ncbi:MAG: tRNA 4-thiouridine(8) synthase ThiI [Deltaproteobacteria bacterium]|nr:tRNA 4-thiouridine(8) synthase ThiI [Deltaproteobacteria bacterium]